MQPAGSHVCCLPLCCPSPQKLINRHNELHVPYSSPTKVVT